MYFMVSLPIAAVARRRNPLSLPAMRAGVPRS